MVIKILIGFGGGLLVGMVIGWKAKKMKAGKRAKEVIADLEKRAKNTAYNTLSDAQNGLSQALENAKRRLK